MDVLIEINEQQSILSQAIPVKEDQDGLKTLSFYQTELRKILPEDIFKRTPLRLFYLAFFIPANMVLIYLTLYYFSSWPLKLIAGVLIGTFNTGMAFLAHETLHGAIIKNKKLQDFIGFIGFGPFLVSPTYWCFWHNFLHHGHTQLLIRDPDAFPTLGIYKKSKFMQRAFNLTPGSKNILSYFYFFYWFSFQSILNQSYMRFGNKMWEKMNHKRVTIEFLFLLTVASSYIYFVGASNFLWLVLIPFMIQNYGVMSYISTNHNISPLTKINDPLVNSLTVTNNPVLEFLHLNFGYHVEHHIFPRMSSFHAKKVHQALKKNFSDRYQFMPKLKALSYLYQTPRIYKSRTELIHPKTLEVYKTL